MQDSEVIVAGHGLAGRSLRIELQKRGIQASPVEIGVSENGDIDFGVSAKDELMFYSKQKEYRAKVIVFAMQRKKKVWDVEGFSHYRNTDVMWNMKDIIKSSKNEKIGIVGSGGITYRRANELRKRGFDVVIFDEEKKEDSYFNHIRVFSGKINRLVGSGRRLTGIQLNNDLIYIDKLMISTQTPDPYELVHFLNFIRQPEGNTVETYFKRQNCGIFFLNLNNYTATNSLEKRLVLDDLMGKIEGCLKRAM